MGTRLPFTSDLLAPVVGLLRAREPIQMSHLPEARAGDTNRARLTGPAVCCEYLLVVRVRGARVSVRG